MTSFHVRIFLFILIATGIGACKNEKPDSVIDDRELAARYFDTDAAWYENNIPFFECSDKKLEAVYYYRWKMYKAHIRRVADNGFVITEFINHVGWDQEPYCTIDAASMHHIDEGRWLRDDRYINGYIYNLFQQGGNNRHYSESIADAAYNRYLVNGDSAFVVAQLDSMIDKYNQWQDHWDSAKNMYYIAAMPDATEFTIASIDAADGNGGFDGGEAFRPTINSYMYANAMAIAHIASLKGEGAIAGLFQQKALALKHNVEKYLWNDSLKHFTDRYQESNEHVHYWDFIRGRELAGMIPWCFNLPSDSPLFNSAWKHVVDTSQLQGAFGLRTNEPSYPYYFKQFIYYMGQRGSQWNGPSWPYQSSQTINAMANFLNNYSQSVVSNSGYLKLLRLFANQHYLPDGKLDLVENYDPNIGGPIVYYYWSNHYNHSSFNNLVITGLCGIRPSSGDTLAINPLVDSSIHYFCLQDLPYHGHSITLVYDEDGNRYKLGKGITVFVDGEKSALRETGGKHFVAVGPVVIKNIIPLPRNPALNVSRSGYPKPSASVDNMPDTSLYQAIDGKVWYFPEITNRWTTMGSTSKSDWFSVDFGKENPISGLHIYLVSDSIHYAAPEEISIEYLKGNTWTAVTGFKEDPEMPVGNTVNSIRFDKILTRQIRVHFRHDKKQIAVSELECF